MSLIEMEDVTELKDNYINLKKERIKTLLKCGKEKKDSEEE